MQTIVQKFGGTSVRTGAHRQRAIDWVQLAVNADYRVVVVVSAMGRNGDPYATDSLLSLIDGYAPQDMRERDRLISSGEIISGIVMAHQMRQAGLNAIFITGGQAGIITDNVFGDARIIDVRPSQLERYLEQRTIPVVAGFQGQTIDGEVTTLGRGGSDTTAVALGAALDAEMVDIFTDVDGIKTADPKMVPNARTISQMDYEEVFQLANLGARVIHPRAVEIARQFSVPLRVRSTFSDSLGTLVAPGRALDPWGHRNPDHAVSGVTHMYDLVQFAVVAPESATEDWVYRLFSRLGQAGVSVDLINLFPHMTYFCVPSVSEEVTDDILLTLNYSYDKNVDRAKVSIIGSAIQGLPGVMGRVVGAMTRAQIEVLQSSDSHSTITLLVHRKNVEGAVRALHIQFGLDKLAKEG